HPLAAPLVLDQAYFDRSVERFESEPPATVTREFDGFVESATAQCGGDTAQDHAVHGGCARLDLGRLLSPAKGAQDVSLVHPRVPERMDWDDAPRHSPVRELDLVRRG